MTFEINKFFSPINIKSAGFLKMKVCEIFASIQGESTYAGLPCVFVRMTGCNLRCSYCDTAYAYEEGIEMSGDEIFKEIKKHGINLVEITGGEPLLQRPQIGFLIDRLIQSGFKVLIETNGSISIRDINPAAVVIMDIKTPNSGMHEKFFIGNLDYLKPKDEVKLILTDRRDYEWAKEIILQHDLISRCKVLMSPAYGILSPETLSEWIIADRLKVRLNLQLHKYIFGSERRGV